MTSKSVIPKRGEIWLVNFEPTIGAEIKKTRPAVVLSSDAVGNLPIKIIIPLTEWKSYFIDNIWHVQIIPDSINRLSKESAIDVLQLRGVDTKRFIRKIGELLPDIMTEITIAVAAVIEYRDS